jgi:hypothetical protein
MHFSSIKKYHQSVGWKKLRRKTKVRRKLKNQRIQRKYLREEKLCPNFRNPDHLR